MRKISKQQEDMLAIPADGIRQSVQWKLRSDELEQDLVGRELSLLEGRGGVAYDQRGKRVEREAFTEEEIETLSATRLRPSRTPTPTVGRQS
jgi:hypothetical protein